MLSDLINENYKKLNDADLYSLKRIETIGKDIEKMNIEQVASHCDTSKSSILRLTQKLGFSGYSEFKNYIKWKTPKSTAEHLPYTDLKADFKNTCIHLESSNQLEEIAKLIRDSNQVLVYGTGQAQRYCAMEFQRVFMQVNKYIYYVGASDEFRLLAKGLEKGSVVIIISLSGDLKKIKDIVQMMKLRDVKVISLTNFQNNELAALADHRLYAVSSDIPIGENLIHSSFVNFFVVIEYLFRKYLEL
jgi:RpiR family glv operon transcriptional regulator